MFVTDKQTDKIRKTKVRSVKKTERNFEMKIEYEKNREIKKCRNLPNFLKRNRGEIS